MLTPYQSLSLNHRAQIDALIAQWWAQLVEDGELESTFGNGAIAISEFYKLLSDRERLFIFDTDDQGICLAFIVTPILSGAFLTLWLAKRHRASAEAMAEIAEGYETVLQHYPVVIGVTKQEKLLRVHQHWGYTILGEVPHLFDGERTWVVVLTREAFAAAQERREAHGRGRDTLG